MSYEKTTIMAALSRIHSHELVLPDIQRDFVWQPERIYKLLDSILRGYPFGTLLFWNTRQRLQYREFSKDWDTDQSYAFQIKEDGQKGTVVLDGQQRLQSLYLSIHGSYEQQTLHFDLLSGADQLDLSELKYRFEFVPAGKAEDNNRQYQGQQYWVPLRDLANIPGPAQLALRTQQYLTLAGIEADSEAGQRLSQNLSNAFFRMRFEDLLNYYTVDKEYGEDGLRTSIDEILEIFVRVNSGGQVLSKSDLMFSLMQLHWEDAATHIASLRDELNNRGRFEFDKDFILKCALVCCGRGARYEVNKLRNLDTVRELKDAFPRLSDALIACVDWVVNTARFQDGRVLGSYNALIPFVYFLYLQPHQRAKGEGTKLAMSQALYLALMTRAFTRYADSRIDRLVQQILNPAHQVQTGEFPLQEICRLINEYEGHTSIDDWLLQNNVPLLMNIVEGGSLLPEGRRYYRAEYDHIFPKSKLMELRYPDEQVNHYANFRLISKHDNIWKSNQDPKPYFLCQPKVMPRYLIPARHLDYDQFPQFLEARREMIWERVRTFLGISTDQADPVAEMSDTEPPSRPGDVPHLSAVDDRVLIHRVLTRLPLPEGPRLLIRALWDAGEAGLSFAELATAASRTKRQLAGVTGALGKRITGTEGVAAAHPGVGIGLLFGIWREHGEWWYRLRPTFRQALAEDADLARLVLGSGGSR